MREKIKTDICVELIVLSVLLLIHFFAVETKAGSFYREYPVETAQTEEADTQMEKKAETQKEKTADQTEEDGDQEPGQSQEAAAQTEEAAAQPVESIAESVIGYAREFVGNPYVWGGTSLTQGADCSGFVQSVYGTFGVALPRTSREQALVGRRMITEEAEPGDLIFYARDGEIYHVVIYTGDGQSVQAKSSKEGITCAPVDYEHAVWAVRVL